MAATKGDYNFLGLLIPSGVKLPLDPQDCPLPKKPGQKVHATVAELITWIMAQMVVPYCGNRGGNNLINVKTYKSILKNGLIADVMGEFSFGIYEGKPTLCCWHSRSKGAVARYLAGNMTPAEMKAIVSVSFVADFLKAYQAHGIGGQAHTTKMKINTKDFAYGVYIKRLKELVIPSIAESFSKFSTPFSTIFYSMSLELKTPDISWDWIDVYKRRGTASAKADLLSGELVITDEQIQEYAQAILYWNELMNAIKLKAYPVIVTDVCGSAGLFGYFTCTHYANKMQNFSKDLGIIADRMCQNLDSVKLIQSQLCRARHPLVEKYTIQLEDILAKRRKKAI